MKNQILKINITVLVLSLLFISCSSNEESSNTEENPTETKQFIKTIQKQNPESWQKGNLFFYKNDKLEYVYQDTCGGELYYFEYNSSGKITKQYYGTTNLDRKSTRLNSSHV